MVKVRLIRHWNKKDPDTGRVTIVPKGRVVEMTEKEAEDFLALRPIRGERVNAD